MLTMDEVHAFVIGMFETMAPWDAKEPMPYNYPSPLTGEYHYYRAGRALGWPIAGLIVIGLLKLAKEVLL